MSSNTLTKACAAAAVATSWGVGQQAQAFVAAVEPPVPVQISLSPTTAVSNLYFIYSNNGSSSSLSDLTLLALGSVPAGGTLTRNLSLPVSSFDSEYTFIGLYSDPTNQDPGEQSGIALATNSGFFSEIIGETFEFLFGGSESALETALTTGDETTLGNFFIQNSASNIFVNDFFNFEDSPVTGTLVNFSEANDGGSTSASLIPEPSSLALFGSLGSFFLLRRRRA